MGRVRWVIGLTCRDVVEVKEVSFAVLASFRFMPKFLEMRFSNGIEVCILFRSIIVFAFLIEGTLSLFSISALAGDFGGGLCRGLDECFCKLEL